MLLNVILHLYFANIRGSDEAPHSQFKGVVDLKEVLEATPRSISLEYKSLVPPTQPSKSRYTVNTKTEELISVNFVAYIKSP